MEIRSADPEDARLIAEELWYPLAAEMEQYSPLNELTDDAAGHAVEGFADLLDEDDRFAFLLDVDGEAVGFVSGEVGERPTRVRGRYAEITDLYVRDDHRNRGYGSRLVERVEELAAAEDCDFLRVSAEWDNDGARSLYADRGYEPKQVTFTRPVE